MQLMKNLKWMVMAFVVSPVAPGPVMTTASKLDFVKAVVAGLHQVVAVMILVDGYNCLESHE